MRAGPVFATALLVAALSGSAAALRLPSAPRCPVFPRSNPWNRRVDRLRAKYQAFRAKFPDRKPIFYRGRERWMELPPEFR